MEDKLRLGGMALRNGLLVHGPTHWAVAVRAADGTMKSASGPKPRFRAADRVPGLRGVVRLAEAMAVIPLVKKNLPEAQLPFQDASVVGVATGASLAGALLRKRVPGVARSEEHTSELQSRQYLVCRLLLEKKKNTNTITILLINLHPHKQ